VLCVAQENKDLQKAAETEWASIYSELQRLLRRGVTVCVRDRASLPPQAADKYFISGTVYSSSINQSASQYNKFIKRLLNKFLRGACYG